MSYSFFFDLAELPDGCWLLVALGATWVERIGLPAASATSSKFAPGEPENCTVCPVTTLAPPTLTGFVPVNFQNGIFILRLCVAYSYPDTQLCFLEQGSSISQQCSECLSKNKRINDDSRCIKQRRVRQNGFLYSLNQPI